MMSLRFCTIKPAFLEIFGKWLPFTLLIFGVGGCANPEARLDRSLDRVRDLKDSGNYVQAIEVLEALNVSHPENRRVLQAMALAYAMDGDYFSAGLFFEQAARSGGEDQVGLHLMASDHFIQAGDLPGAVRNLQAYLEAFPEETAIWFQVGELLAEQNQNRAALDAYLNGLRRQEGLPDAATELAIGLLFRRLDNLPQARRYFSSAASQTGAHQAQARLELLRVLVSERRWDEAEGLMDLLQRQHPGVLESSEMVAVQRQLRDWRAAQEAFARIREAQLTPDPAASADPESGLEEEGLSSPEPEDSALVAEAERSETDPGDAAETGTTSVRVGDGSPSASVEGKPVLAENDREPAEPEPESMAEVEPESPESAMASGLVSLADASLQAGDYEAVIDLLWDELGLVGHDARVWHRLSLAFFALEEFTEAEMTALEAMRRAPQDVSLRLNYLRVAQRMITPARFLTELERAYDAFPSSPEVILALARGYERISRSQRTADLLYLRFLELAPNHSRAGDIRRELQARQVISGR